MESIRVAFPQRPDLQQRITDAIAKHPSTKPLFEDIAQHVAHIGGPATHPQTLSLNQVEHPSKKRKLDTSDAAKWDKVLSFADISFSIPVRKKLKLEIGRHPDEGFRAKNESEVEVSAEWHTIRHVFCLPVPEKAQAQYNFCVMTDDLNANIPHMVWTVPDAIPKHGTVDPPPGAESTDTYLTLLQAIINTALKTHKKSITTPSEEEFASQIVQAHRKSEKAYHVKAFRGSKDGYLFFLPTGIFWGFKKPLQFFAFDEIDSVSYTSVLQRTFNLNVTARAVPDAHPVEFEFSMLDQVDFAGIDAYVKRHQLQDASMAEQRRAKKVNVNGVKGRGGADAEEGEGGEAQGELEKAAREAQDLQDEEDEQEDENFDPGSEGESEGEGDDSDEEGGEDGGGGGGGGGYRDGDEDEDDEVSGEEDES